MSRTSAVPRRRDALSWIGAAVAVAGLVVVGWAFATAAGGILHSNPAYAIVLGVTAVVCALALALCLRGARRRSVPARIGRTALIVVSALAVAVVAWLRPYSAVPPALEAMSSDETVRVAESATSITLSPASGPSDVGVLFQPGALVDPRAYAAVLRPLAADGHTVVIVKPALGIAFFSLGSLAPVAEANPDVSRWVLAGHSLGGTVAAIQASGGDDPPVAGLLLFASYPASDIRGSVHGEVLSISGSRDGLSTPEKIDASRANLPADAEFVVIEGAAHAQFGAYGPQPGDGEPSVSDARAREEISAVSLRFVEALDEASASDAG